MKTLRISLMTFVAGIAAGFTAAYLLLHKPVSSTDGIITRHISGDKILHEKFDFSGSKIKFKTVAEGKGEASTEIPKTLVPEANAWISKVNSLSFTYGYMFNGNNGVQYMGIMYGHRSGNVLLGGGIDLSTDFFGVKASAGLCW